MNIPFDVNSSGVTPNLILGRLQQKVSVNNANLILHMAKTQVGLQSIDNATCLNKDQATALCMRLINQGGPAFHVGQSVYKEYIQTLN